MTANMKNISKSSLRFTRVHEWHCQRGKRVHLSEMGVNQ